MRGREGGCKNGILRRFLGLKLGRQGERGGSRNPKLGETSFIDASKWKISKKVYQLRKHMAINHKKEKIPHICPICEKQFVEKYHLNRHFSAVHEKQSDNAKCEICNKEYTTKEGLRLESGG